jgi:hypothetical protein
MAKITTTQDKSTRHRALFNPLDDGERIHSGRMARPRRDRPLSESEQRSRANRCRFDYDNDSRRG